MTVSLASAMEDILDAWVDDLPGPWRVVVDHVVLGFDEIDPALELEPWEPVFPVRKAKQFPGMPKGAHAMRAYDGVAPDDVRCLILGQDPYPEPGFSTGRAFEAGNVRTWRELDKMFSKSIRAYTQLIVAFRTGDPSWARSFADWPRVLEALESGDIEFECPATIAGRHESEGVLLLNAALTLSRFALVPCAHQTQGHLPLWAPLIEATLAALIKQDRPIVFLSFGDAAAAAFASVGLVEGHHGRHGTILRPHPAFADKLLSLQNPFNLCNSYLEAMGEQPIAW